MGGSTSLHRDQRRSVLPSKVVLLKRGRDSFNQPGRACAGKVREGHHISIKCSAQFSDGLSTL